MKINYKAVYPRWVLDDIQEGNEVFVLDKFTRSVAVVNDMTIRTALGLIEAAEKSTNGRFVFWYAEEVKVEAPKTEETKAEEEEEEENVEEL